MSGDYAHYSHSTAEDNKLKYSQDSTMKRCWCDEDGIVRDFYCEANWVCDTCKGQAYVKKESK